MKKKILIADDSITIQKVIEMAFLESNYEVVSSGDGKDALSKLNQHAPDIVLADTIMPEMDGYALCSTIKSMPDFSHVPVLLLSGTFEPFDRERAESSGADGIIMKPFESRLLVEKVEQVLNPIAEEVIVPEIEIPAPEWREEEHPVIDQEMSSVEETPAEDFPVDLEDALEISEALPAEPHSFGERESRESPEITPQRLTEEEMDSIARKVFHMLSEDVVKKIISETISETAERIIRERIRELEEKASE